MHVTFEVVLYAARVPSRRGSEARMLPSFVVSSLSEDGEDQTRSNCDNPPIDFDECDARAGGSVIVTHCSIDVDL
jgi:hypothetical protein